ncbi:hypothetical protein [Neolewinella persica]|uniref:hypothetical protein n=1 Tax=Neolewinella persica TaxID=70998 RepID=UPI00036D6524|nr:hypothetical protein [Neolewinella persica]
MINITLKRRQDENPVAGQNISLEFTEPAMGWTKVRCTDASGIASFPVDSGKGTLFINGGRYLSGWLSENLTVFIDRPALQIADPIPFPHQDETPGLDASTLDWEIWG